MPTNESYHSANLVWYASYGSNLKLERFMCYIKGGFPVGSIKPQRYNGCYQDKNDPRDSRPLSLKFELYFAGRSRTWGNGGVAFIRENPERGPTLGRMYLISDEQFNDVVMQENLRIPDGSRFLPGFEQLLGHRELSLSNNPWYGKLLNIGSEMGHPILTFTTARTDILPNPNAPSEEYVKIIASGIKEAYPQMSNAEILAYFLRADGVHGKIDPMEIDRWIREA